MKIKDGLNAIGEHYLYGQGPKVGCILPLEVNQMEAQPKVETKIRVPYALYLQLKKKIGAGESMNAYVVKALEKSLKGK